MEKRVHVVNVTAVQNVGKLSLIPSIRSTSDRQVSEEDVRIVLQSHVEGSSLRGISRISGARLRHSRQHCSGSGTQSANGTQC